LLACASPAGQVCKYKICALCRFQAHSFEGIDINDTYESNKSNNNIEITESIRGIDSNESYDTIGINENNKMSRP